MNLQEQARSFLDRFNTKEDWEAFHKAFETLPKDLSKVVSQLRYRDGRTKMAQYFVPENAKSSKEHTSPSGTYRLKVTCFETKPGSWSYSQGLVYRQGSDEPIFEVQRNYSAFPFSWVEDHQNGHAYLICGEDYQGQTVLELDTGKRIDYVPDSATLGHGFCWVEHKYDRESNLLVVCGCFWACPYQYNFYDFSNPMSGWPLLEMEEWADADAEWPFINHQDGTLKCFQTQDEDEDDEAPSDTKALAAVKTFKREGFKLVLLEEWVSEKEQARRAANDAAQKQYDEEIANFKATDPLYLAFLEGLKDSVFSPDDYMSIGQTYPKWCPGFEASERRMCRRIANQKKNPKLLTIDFEWGAVTGPVKLVIYNKEGNVSETKFFMEHSVASINEAFAYAKAVLS